MTATDAGTFPQERARRLGSRFAWAAVAAVAAPFAIVLHELGHYGAGLLLGFEGLQLHYGSVSHSRAPGTSLDLQAAAFSAAGPAVTLAIVLASALLAYKRPALSPYALGVAVGAGIRSVGLGLAFLMVQLQHPGAVGNFDEFKAATAAGIPPWLAIALNVTAILSAWAFCVPRVQPGRRISALALSTSGAAIGISLYMALLGPALLP